MAIRTQIRLPQITGSIGTGKDIDDAINSGAAIAAGDISAGNLSDTLSYMAAAIKRIHGAGSFTNSAAGAFAHTIDVTGAVTASLGAKIDGDLAVGSNASFSGNIVIPNNGNIGSTGATTAISIDGDGVVTFGDDIVIPNDGYIGSTGATTAIQISSSGKVTIAGDLDINGTTTTIDTQNLTIEDSIIGLGVSGSDGTWTDLGDRGIVFAKGATGAKLPAFYYDGTGDIFQLGKSATSAASASFAAPAFGVSENDYLNLRLAGVQFGSANDRIAFTGAGSLDLSGSGDTNVVTAGDLTVRTEGGFDIVFQNDSNTLFTLDNAFAHEIVGSLTIDGDGSNPGSLVLKDNDGNATTTIKSAGDVTTYSMLLPAGVGTSGQVLSISSVDGSELTLGFAEQGGAANSSKLINEVTASLTSGDRLSDSVSASSFDLSAVSEANAFNAIDVFVNGQLLQSSSVAFGALAGSSAGDYAINTDDLASSDLKFTFDLEADDTVTIIVRA